MIIFPAIDLYEKKAVRLLRGDYKEMTVYSNNPVDIAVDFVDKGADHVHLVDLEGAKLGTTPNLDVVSDIAKHTPLFTEIGGGIRNMETVEKYLDAGVDRVILGTAAVNDRPFLEKAVHKYGNKIAVGADVKDGFVAIKGWIEKSEISLESFLWDMEQLGITNIICTDISKDGAMAGTNLELYKKLSETHSVELTASGGVSTMEDIRELRKMNLYGAIIGKAYYTGAIDLREAIQAGR